MAQECADHQSSVTISSYTPPSCWEPIPYNYWHQPNLIIPSSMSSCGQGEHVSNISANCFTDSSNHSGLTVEDSSRRIVASHPHPPSREIELMDEHVSDSQLWTHILLGGLSNIGEFGTNQKVGDNLVGANLSSNSSAPISAGMFEPVYDYLKKMDNDWEFTSSSSSNNNNFRKQVNGLTNTESPQNVGISKRLTKLGSNWSVSPPPHHDPEVNAPRLDQIISCYDQNQFDQYYSYGTLGGKKNNNIPSLLTPLYNHGQLDHVKMEAEIEDSVSVFKRSLSFNDLRYDIGLSINDPVTGDYYSKYYCGVPTCSSARSFTDLVALNGQPCKPLASDVKASARSSTSLDWRKQGLQSPSQAGKGHGGQNNEIKKKRISEDASPTALKKPRQESSTAVKVQAPKAKLQEKISVLQQIVSPFGKTDTASVLLEAIQYIKFLQEQVQLLSNPYMKNLHKEQWAGRLEIKEKGDHTKLDLRSKGLCLVPISCTPQVYQENAGSDFWTPTYRSCLYR